MESLVQIVSGAQPLRDTSLEVRLARDALDLRAAQRLRYRVFVAELGARGAMVDHAARLERDRFDRVCDHLLLVDKCRDPATRDHVVGAYRLLPGTRAAHPGGFYSEAEYDLTPLKRSGRRLLELGRSCVDPAYRNGPAILLLWNGLADYVLARGIEVLFGVASFHGTDPQALRVPLSWLHHHHLAPPPLRVRARPERFQRMDLLPAEALERDTALAQIPGLIRGYLRAGGYVGEGAFVDHAFNTVDVALVMDTALMSARRRAFLARAPRAAALP